MYYTRGRVALSLKYTANKDLPIEPGADLLQLHVGHARTLLLGSLICKELGCPFHVRIDGPVKEDTGDRGGGLLDTIDLLNTLRIDFDKMYWQAQTVPPKYFLENELGERALAFWNGLSTAAIVPDYYRCLMIDDIITYNPSLIIRGRDFATPALYGNGQVHVNGTIAHINAEEFMYSAAGRQKHEFNTPMIMIDDGKMSKSQMRIVHWKVLASVPSELVKKFLVATATHPEDPLSYLEEPFAIKNISEKHYVWSWEIWNELVRMV